MKILNSECIRKEENALLAAMNASLDSNDILKKVKDHYNIDLAGSTVLIEDDIVVYNDDIAFKFGYETRIPFSIILDRVGDYAGMTTGDYVLDSQEEKRDSNAVLLGADEIKMREKEVTEAIATALDKNQLSDLIEKELNIKIFSSLEYQKGKFATHNKQVVYRLSFESQFRFYLLIDRNGNFLTLADSGGFCEEPKDMTNENPMISRTWESK